MTIIVIVLRVLVCFGVFVLTFKKLSNHIESPTFGELFGEPDLRSCQTPRQVTLIRRFAEEAFNGRSLVAQMIMGCLPACFLFRQIAQAIGVLTSSIGGGACVRFEAWELVPLQSAGALWRLVAGAGCRVPLQGAAARCLWECGAWSLHAGATAEWRCLCAAHILAIWAL